MTKRYCDICKEEIPNYKWKWKPCGQDKEDKKIITRIICERCLRALENLCVTGATITADKWEYFEYRPFIFKHRAFKCPRCTHMEEDNIPTYCPTCGTYVTNREELKKYLR